MTTIRKMTSRRLLNTFSARDEDDVSRLKLPRLSEVAKGQSSFECPFCWTIQTFRWEKAWKKHALSDLRP